MQETTLTNVSGQNSSTLFWETKHATMFSQFEEKEQSSKFQ